jgi:hypothetical protein
MRASGQYGPRVEVGADADPQPRLVGFIEGLTQRACCRKCLAPVAACQATMCVRR